MKSFAKMRLALAAVIAIGAAGAQPVDDRPRLEGRIAALELGVERAESIRAIKRLQYAYGHYVEFGLWHDFADLFTEEAVAHYPAGDLGREAIRELFLEQVGQGQLGLADGRLYPHLVLQPVVTLDPDGRTGHGRWHVLTLLGGLGGNATWVGGLYENDYVREDGVWRIAELRTNTQFSGSYASGWTNPPPQTGATAAICENYIVNDCSIAYHYDAARAGAPLGISLDSALPAAAAEATAAEASTPDLTVRAAAIERRIGRLLDESEVRNLHHAFGYYFDRRLWDDVADLFAADATFELGLQGVYRGRASIRDMLEQFGGPGIEPGELDDHLALETIVTVAPDGRTARARSIDFSLAGTRDDDGYRAEWREAVFENTYVKESGLWKIASVHRYPRFATDYALGWAEDARPAPAPSETFPPDAPPTVRHGVYPEFYVPPFHFTNPATGAPPQYPNGTEAGQDTERGTETIAAAVTVATAGAQRSDDDRSPPLSARLDEAERRLAVAVAYDAVENIANAYNYALDEFDRSSVDALFARGGRVVSNHVEVAGDRPPVLAVIDIEGADGGDGRPHGVLAIHQTLQPVIHVAADGASAKIRFRLLESAGRLGAESVWIAGIYEGEAVARDGVWKMDRLSINYTWAAEYASGWAGAAPFAAIGAAPFHYDNPVSGRAPPIATRR
jgi:SnoaL-like domain